MSDSMNYLECWIHVAVSLFSQALAGEPTLSEALPKPLSNGAFGFVATIEGEEQGRFAVMLDGGVADAPLLGEGVDQRAGWAELLKEVADAAVGELLAKTGRKCQVAAFTESAGETKLSRAFQLKAGDRSWSLQVNSEVHLQKAAAGGKTAKTEAKSESRTAAAAADSMASSTGGQRVRGSRSPAEAANVPSSTFSGDSEWPGLSRGLELLLDVELEASLRFGAREMPLGEILDLGPGDVVQLDRHISDPVDLIVGDKIVARGEVVLVNGNFGLRVTEVAEPQRRLESIRCLF
jgi:flagellar motor switch protein FliN/FliY